MTFIRMILASLLFAGLLGTPVVEAKASAKQSQKAKSKKKARKPKLICAWTGKKGHRTRTCRKPGPIYSLARQLRKEPLPPPSGQFQIATVEHPNEIFTIDLFGKITPTRPLPIQNGGDSVAASVASDSLVPHLTWNAQVAQPQFEPAANPPSENGLENDVEEGSITTHGTAFPSQLAEALQWVHQDPTRNWWDFRGLGQPAGFDFGKRVNPDAINTLKSIWRCKRTDAQRDINPNLFVVLSYVYDHFQRPILLTSGHRNQQNKHSYHFLGSAADISIPGVSLRELEEFAESLDAGGMGVGIYPHSGFIHVDLRPDISMRWVDNGRPHHSRQSTRFARNKKAKRKPSLVVTRFARHNNHRRS